ncbi:MAG: DUF4157 domain-containing protein, partial [Deltaproteobacteria bacterium]|nr:DUF4157 domain-containing protein [Deltaproteobacteria bacterium]
MDAELDLDAATADKQQDDRAPWPGKRTLTDMVKRSSSAPLPTAIRQQLEGALGQDLTGVRVHTDAAAQEAAQALQANAFTIGQAIYFGAGTWDPSSRSGQRLIAHEVAHTVQQRGAAPVKLDTAEVSTPGDAHEVEAESFGMDFVTRAAAPTQVAPTPGPGQLPGQMPMPAPMPTPIAAVSRSVISRAVIMRDQGPLPGGIPPAGTLTVSAAPVSVNEAPLSDMVDGARRAIREARARGGTAAVVSEIGGMRGSATGVAARAIEDAVQAECSADEKTALSGRRPAAQDPAQGQPPGPQGPQGPQGATGPQTAGPQG